MNPSKAIIFDLDGTLVDSLEDITRALNQALNEHHRRSVEQDSVRAWIGDGLPVLCRRALADTGDCDGLEGFVKSVRSSYEARCTELTRPYRNILKTLELLKAREVPMAVLSNKPHALTQRVLEDLGLTIFFLAVRGYTKEESKKPSPKQAISIADEMNVAYADVLLVGDSVVDIRTARNAGMQSVAVTWGFQKKSKLEAENPDLMIDDPLELPGLLQ
ncbi:MAG: HAD-IA family hydrolase [Phycisphaerales bacterium]|nr:HAD-IA family hydrolase [Phycisphaerales bacterium]